MFYSYFIYYYENFRLVKFYVMEFDKDNSIGNRNAYKTMNYTNLESDLTFT